MELLYFQKGYWIAASMTIDQRKPSQKSAKSSAVSYPPAEASYTREYCSGKQVVMRAGGACFERAG